MAWRISDQVVRGEIDSRSPGRVTGRIWLTGQDKAVELEGNPWRDLAGHVLKFHNLEPKPGDHASLAIVQRGAVGDMTASRKVKVPDCSMEELMEHYTAKQPFPWHWGNSLYLEWYSDTNGRVVIESASYQLELGAEASWTMSEDDEADQQSENVRAMTDFLAQLAKVVKATAENQDEDGPQSLEEAQADANDARMQLLLDRVTARMEREDFDIEDFERIHEQERARLMHERGETEPEPTAQQIEERHRWVEEMNAISEDAMADVRAEKWKGRDPVEEVRHPLVETCTDLAVTLHHEVKAGQWVTEVDQQEHPLREIVFGVSSASAKLAGALGRDEDDEEWPPDPLFAAGVIVRLKKAIGYLRDVLVALDSTEEENLATPEWRQKTRTAVNEILTGTRRLLAEARAVLDPGGDDDLGIF